MIVTHMEVDCLVKIKKSTLKLIDQIAEMEVAALHELLLDPETRKNTQVLAAVRRFMEKNHLITDPETPGVGKLQEEMSSIPELEDMVQ